MAFIEKITQPGNHRISSLDGRVQFDTGKSVISGSDNDGNTIAGLNGDGITTYEKTGTVMMRSGADPSGSDGITVIAVQGNDALANL